MKLILLSITLLFLTVIMGCSDAPISQEQMYTVTSGPDNPLGGNGESTEEGAPTSSMTGGGGN
ncbi:MAG: hypothetical protein WC748_07225 [Legionellales bacterium]|jgi:hypothetical protein